MVALVRGWREAADGLLAGVLAAGSHAVGFRAVLCSSTGDEIGLRLAALSSALRAREASGAIDRRQLDDGVRDLRGRLLRLLDAIVVETRTILAAVEAIPEFLGQSIAARRVFYSWQSDLPNATNRGLIGDALEVALTYLAADPVASVDPAPDRDTRGVAGAPDIAATIFGKIDAAAVFVADVSFVTAPGAERPAPNPNVLVELGYAMRALGPSRIVLVFNTHFGRVEELPFDLRARRVLTYVNAPDAAERAPARRSLAATLKDAVGTCLREGDASMAAQPTIRIDLTRMVELGRTSN